MNITNFKEKPYFESLPRWALPALQAAYDKASAKTFSALAVYNGLCRDLDEVGHEKPTQPVFNAWFDAVQQGQITRPGAAKVPEETAPADTLVAEGKPFFTPDFPADDTDIVDRLIAEAREELARDLEVQAKRRVVERLRLMADSIEGGI